MAQRPIWRGTLRLALVSCPVALYSANHDRGSLHFNLINPATGNRIRMVTQDAETGEALSRSDLVKGYEFKKDTYLIIDEEDFERARVDSSNTIKIEKFVSRDSIDPIYFDASYYLAPDGESGQDVYAVLRDAIQGTKRVALARVVIARRERPIAIMPIDRGLVAHTLHEARELNEYAPLFAGIPTGKPDAEMVQLATQLIERQSGRYEPADIEDRYEARLREVIEAKLKGEGIVPGEEEEPDRSNVVDLMAALRKSLGQEAPVPKAAGRKPAPAKAPARKTGEPAKAAATKDKTAPAKTAGRKRA